MISTTNSKKQRIRVNNAINSPKVRLVDPEGLLNNPLLGSGDLTGIMNPRRALEMAEKLNLDLVEVSPNADPPVVRIMDYGKYLFGVKKAKKKQKAPKSKLKELKLRPVTGEGDYQVKLRNLKGFLEHGDKVKITIRFRGREIAHQDLGNRLLERIVKDIEGFGQIEQTPKLEGRQMVMIIAPVSKK
ncbi:MAG TPA: translation initiation factor IF-3 [Gammaproteobacteria bacterium]|nr:translation initiation factor IF-3 [Gammaproteobacteria bacterium]